MDNEICKYLLIALTNALCFYTISALNTLLLVGDHHTRLPLSTSFAGALERSDKQGHN